MMRLSDIKSSETELQDYYAQLQSQHITPAWIGGGITREPKSKAVPWVWHWRDLRPQAMRAAQLVGTEQAERRVLNTAVGGGTMTLQEAQDIIQTGW
jgi:gentisate 1,2-dioxygenase